MALHGVEYYGGVGCLQALQIARAEALHRLAGEKLDHADQHRQLRIVLGRVVQAGRIRRPGIGSGRIRKLGGTARGGDFHAVPADLGQGGIATPHLKPLARLEGLAELAGRLQLDIE